MLESRATEFQQAVDRIASQLNVPAAHAARPALIVLVGLPGTGKSTLAQALPAAIVESDYMRRELFNRPRHTSAESEFVHRVAHAVIRRLLQRGASAISDATNLIEFHREWLYRLAAQTDAHLLVVHVTAPEEIVRRRLAERQAAPSPQEWSEATWDVYLRMKHTEEPIRRPHITVSMDGDKASAVEKVLRAVRMFPSTPLLLV